MSPLTSLLFVPGSRPERFAKAAAASASVACIDLEDAVAESDKDAARAAAIDAARCDGRFAIRTNGLRTTHGLRDLVALRDAGATPALILLPMADGPGQVAIVREVLALPDDRIVPLIETAAALRIAHEIAAAPGVAAVMFGGGDLAAELGVALAWEPLLAARGQFLLACAGRPTIDVPFVNLDDADGLRDEARRARTLGFTGKAAIHPAQVATIMLAFGPSADELSKARVALAAYHAGGEQAVRHDGRMLEAPLIRRYEAMLAATEGRDHA